MSHPSRGVAQAFRIVDLVTKSKLVLSSEADATCLGTPDHNAARCNFGFNSKKWLRCKL